MINTFSTVMSRATTTPKSRFIDSNLYKKIETVKVLHDTLVPPSDDQFTANCAEQLLQVVRHSNIHKERLKELDPVNTYSKDILQLTDDTYSVLNPTSMECLVLSENLKDPTWCEKSFSVRVDPATMTVEVSSSSIPMRVHDLILSGGLSNKIPLLDDIYLRLKGDLPVDTFFLQVKYTQKFKRDLLTVLDSLSRVKIPWHTQEYNNMYQRGETTYDKLAAVIMNLYEILMT